MDENEKTYWTDNEELLEKFVLGQISDEERIRMEEEIRNCEPCKQKVREELELAAGVRRHGRDALRSRLKTGLMRRQTTPISSNYYIGLAAAVVVVAAGIGLYSFFFGGLESPKQFHQQEIVLTPPDDSSESSFQPETHEGANGDHSVADGTETISGEGSEEGQPSEHVIADAGPIDRTASPASSGLGVSKKEKLSAHIELSESEFSSGSSSIWLIGEVVMVSDRTDERSMPTSRMETADKKDSDASSETYSSAKKAVRLRLAKDEGIVLKQRAIKGLPSELTGLSKQAPHQHSVQTLLEKNDSGISLTLFGDAVSAADLNSAVVESMTKDSLVVVLSRQRIAFRMPAGWNTAALRTK